MDRFIESIKKGFSVVAKGTKQLTKNVAGKTGNLVDITKLNIALNDTDKKVNAIYEKIGKTVYQKYAEGMTVTEDFLDLCEEIDQYILEQESLREQIAELKNSVVCPVCGKSNDKNSEFCSKCGSSFSSREKEPEKNQVIEIVDFEEEE